MKFRIRFILASPDNNIVCTATLTHPTWKEALDEAMGMMVKYNGQLLSIASLNNDLYPTD